MKPERDAAMTHRPDLSDCRDMLTTVFGAMSADLGQIEWLLDRNEGLSGGRRWA